MNSPNPSTTQRTTHPVESDVCHSCRDAFEPSGKYAKQTLCAVCDLFWAKRGRQ